MASRVLKPKFVVDESGKKTAVIVTMKDYERLLAAWEDVADAEDFAVARESAKTFLDTDSLRDRVSRDQSVRPRTDG